MSSEVETSLAVASEARKIKVRDPSTSVGMTKTHAERTPQRGVPTYG
jgi:hypothetical protein